MGSKGPPPTRVMHRRSAESDREIEARKTTMTTRAKKSVEHSEAKMVDGTWSCSLCGSESLDFELFEEAGAVEGCVARGVSAGTVPDPDDMIAWADVEKARTWIAEARTAMEKMGPAAEKAAEAMKEIGYTLETYKVPKWEDTIPAWEEEFGKYSTRRTVIE